MNKLNKLLIYLSLIKIDKTKIKAWLEDKNIEMLKFALAKGMLNERLYVIDTLLELNVYDAIPQLIKIVSTDYLSVSKAALNAIETLDVEKKFQLEIQNLKELIEERSKKKNRIFSTAKKEKVSKHSRMRSLEKVKQQLKRPMYGGKWF